MGLYTNALIKVLQTMCESGTQNKSLCMIGRQNIMVELNSFMKIIESMSLPYDRTIYNRIKDTYPIDSYLFF